MQGVCFCGEDNLLSRASEAKARARSLRGAPYEKCGKSQGHYPKPLDLGLGRMKSFERGMEVRPGVRPNYSVDLGLGVKSQSKAVIAGSSRNEPKFSSV